MVEQEPIERAPNRDFKMMQDVALLCAQASQEDLLIEGFTQILSAGFAAPLGGLLLLDADANQLKYHPTYLHTNMLALSDIPLGEGANGKAALQGVTVYEPAARQSTGICSQLCAPLLLHKRVIGVIEVAHTEADAFTPEQVHLLTLLAPPLAAAIGRLRTAKNVETAARRLGVLHEIEQGIMAAQSPQTVAEVSLPRICSLFACSRVSLALFDYRKKFVYEYTLGSPESPTLVTSSQSPLDHYTPADILQQQPLYHVLDLQNWQPLSASEEKLLLDGVRSYLALRLGDKQEIFGSLNLTADIPNAFTRSQIRFAVQIAGSMALAVKNSRLLEQTRRQAGELVALYETSLTVSSTLDRETILRGLYNQAEKTLVPDVFTAMIFDSETQLVTIELLMEAGSRREDWIGKQFEVKDAGISGWVMQNRTPMLFVDTQVEDTPPTNPRLGSRPIRSWLGVPLLVRDELVGAISVQAYQPGRFDADHRRFLEALGTQAASALQNARLFDQTRQRLKRVQALHDIDVAITQSTELNFVLRVLLEQVTTQLEVDAASILLYQPQNQTLESAARLGFHTGALRKTHLALGEGYAGQAAFQQRLVQVPDLRQQPGNFARSTLLPDEAFILYIAAPLVAKNQLLGVLEVFKRKPLSPSEEWLEFLVALATQGAIAIENALLFKNLQRTNQELSAAYDTTLEGWSRALELRDHETDGHSKRVVQLTLKIAEELGTNEDERVHIRRGALLHDIGKMGIPDKILLKPAPLNEDEWVLMRQHPVYAYQLLSPVPFLRQALDIPYCHHEKWNGTGYPRGLRGEEIPLAARIFAIVDVWDALISDRPYRPAWPRRKALEYIQAESGKHFDPRVVQTFLKLIEKEN